MRSLTRTALLAVTLAAPATAQNVIDTPTSTIEIVGLKRWTIQMIDDSLSKYSPKDRLTAHACAAILRDKLHFADASVTVFTSLPGSTKSYVAVTIVEPADSALIHYKPEFRDSLPTRPEWSAAYAAFKAHNDVAQHAIQSPSFYAAVLSAKDSTAFDAVRPMHDMMVAHTSPADFELARRTVESDGNAANRAMALLVLSNFVDRDSAWRTVADALRDPTGGMVNATAAQVLRLMGVRSPRSVDWAPMADRLRYMIDGTGLFTFDVLLRTLTATSISPALAPRLLANGGAILRAKLHSGGDSSRDVARAFLAQLSGLPATADISSFDAWLDRQTESPSR
ncbi:MAG: hypothetical protein ACREPM_09780 [Gemmatimonadaceae bacterium]